MTADSPETERLVRLSTYQVELHGGVSPALALEMIARIRDLEQALALEMIARIRDLERFYDELQLQYAVTDQDEPTPPRAA